MTPFAVIFCRTENESNSSHYGPTTLPRSVEYLVLSAVLMTSFPFFLALSYGPCLSCGGRNSCGSFLEFAAAQRKDDEDKRRKRRQREKGQQPNKQQRNNTQTDNTTNRYRDGFVCVSVCEWRGGVFLTRIRVDRIPLESRRVTLRCALSTMRSNQTIDHVLLIHVLMRVVSILYYPILQSPTSPLIPPPPRRPSAH